MRGHWWRTAGIYTITLIVMFVFYFIVAILVAVAVQLIHGADVVLVTAAARVLMIALGAFSTPYTTAMTLAGLVTCRCARTAAAGRRELGCSVQTRWRGDASHPVTAGSAPAAAAAPSEAMRAIGHAIRVLAVDVDLSGPDASMRAALSLRGACCSRATGPRGCRPAGMTPLQRRFGQESCAA